MFFLQRLGANREMHPGDFVERCIRFEVQQHRRPRPKIEDVSDARGGIVEPVADWLGHLVQERREVLLPVAENTSDAEARRRADDDALVDLLSERLDSHVFDEATARDFLGRYGPFDPQRAAAVLDEALRDDRTDHHVNVYLQTIREALR